MTFHRAFRQAGDLGQFFVAHGFMVKKRNQCLIHHRQSIYFLPENYSKLLVKNKTFGFIAGAGILSLVFSRMILPCFGFIKITGQHRLFLFDPRQTGVIGNPGDPGGQLGLKFESAQAVECFQVNVLGNILPVFHNWNHFEYDLGNQVFRIFYDKGKCPVIPTKNPINQVLVFRIISNGIVHVLNQTGEKE